MNTNLGEIFRLLNRGLFLEPDAYDEAADGDNTFVEGLFLIMSIGVVIALASIIGSLLGWATTPNLEELKQIVLNGLMQMPWYDMIRDNSEALRMFQQNYDLGWSIARFMTPNPAIALAGLLLVPLGLIISWLWFSLIAQGVARALGGNGSLNQTLGAAALAMAPALLNVFQIIPTIVVAAVGVWTLLARYMAVRRVHENLTWGRALIAVLAPSFVLALIALFLFLLMLLMLPLLGSVLGGFVS